jgi:DNA repair exonuclease SbcCD ATPase subunit
MKTALEKKQAELINKLENRKYLVDKILEYFYESIEELQDNKEQAVDIDTEIYKLKSEIAELKKQEEKESNENIQAWICPRCYRVHSYLSLTCDCLPNTITKNTY